MWASGARWVFYEGLVLFTFKGFRVEGYYPFKRAIGIGSYKGNVSENGNYQRNSRKLSST